MLINDAPCGFMSTDEDGIIIYANETLARWLGFDDGRLPVGFAIQDIFDKASGMYFDAQISPMLHMQKRVGEVLCALAAREAGVKRPVLINATLRETPDGAIDRIDYVFFDATERQQFEKTLRAARSEAEGLASIVKNAIIGIVRINADGQLKQWNATAARLFSDAVHPAEGEDIEAVLGVKTGYKGWLSTAKDHVARDGEYQFEAENGNGKFLNVSVAEINNTENPFAPCDYSIILRNITERIQNNRRLSVMVQELNHRVKNAFAIVAALVRQSLHDPALRSERDKLLDRLQNISKSHSTLTAHFWQDVDISELMKPLAAQVNDPDRFEVSGPSVLLATSQFKVISMAFHELMTNALKYGALSDDKGKVAVYWALGGEEGNALSISWIETGGPETSPPLTRGFGSTMLEDMLALEFDGSVEVAFPPQGLQFRFQGTLA